MVAPTGFSFSIGANAPRVELTVPRAAAVTIIAGSGDVVLGGLVAGLQVTTGSGDVTATDIQGETRVVVGSGDVDLQRVSGGLWVETSSGDVAASQVAGSVTTHSSSGDQEYRDVTGDIAADSSSGDLSLEAVAGIINLTSRSGDQRGRRVQLTGGSRFETRSGDIDLTFVNPLDSLAFDAEAGSGDVTIGTSRGTRLTLGNGPVQVVGRSRSGDQTYRSE